MRFGKEFVSQMIPEWQEAYIDYAYLKTFLQDIQASRNIANPNSKNRPSNLTRRYNRVASSVSENQDIVVNTVTWTDDNELETRYDTAFLKVGEAGGDSEVAFFKTLDREFNKVNSFDKLKVETARTEALALTKQMDALIAFRIKVMEKKNPCLSDAVSVDINAFTFETGSSSDTSKFKEHS